MIPDEKLAQLIDALDGQSVLSANVRITISLGKLTVGGNLDFDDIRGALLRLADDEKAIRIIDYHIEGRGKDYDELANEGIGADEIEGEARSLIFGGHYKSKVTDKIEIEIISSKFTELKNKYKVKKLNKENQLRGSGGNHFRRVLVRNESGTFFYGGDEIKLERQRLPYIVLNILYNHGDDEGYLSYEDIETHLVNAGQQPAKDAGKRNKRINNAVNEHQGLFRYARVKKGRLPNKAGSGKLITVDKGRGIILSRL